MSGTAQIAQREVDKLLDAFIPWLATIDPDSDQPMGRAFVRWRRDRKCGIVLTANGFVDMDSRPSPLKTCFDRTSTL